MASKTQSLGQPTFIMSVPKLERRVVAGRVIIPLLVLCRAQSFREIVDALKPVVVGRVTAKVTRKSERKKACYHIVDYTEGYGIADMILTNIKIVVKMRKGHNR